MSSQSTQAEPPPVVDALDKSKQAAETVQQAAESLAVVHAVLDTQVPAERRNEEVGQAIDQTDQVQDQLSESVELLQDVVKTLEDEVKAKSST
jgi:hypothetical protein